MKQDKKQLGYIAVNQYGETLRLTKPDYPKKQLLDKLSASNAKKMYIDGPKGAKHVGYVISGLWWTIYEVHAWEGSHAL